MNVDTGKWMLSDQSKNILYVYNGGLFFFFDFCNLIK